MNLLRRMRASSPYGASSDTLKPRLRLGENQNHTIGLRPRNCTPFCHSVTSFLAEAGLKRNKEKVSNLICFGPFVPHPLPYSLPHLGRRVLVGCSDSTQESGLWNIERASCFMYTLNFSHVKSRQFPLPAFLK